MMEIVYSYYMYGTSLKPKAEHDLSTISGTLECLECFELCMPQNLQDGLCLYLSF